MQHTYTQSHDARQQASDTNGLPQAHSFELTCSLQLLFLQCHDACSALRYRSKPFITTRYAQTVIHF
ncbi:hypothetical protein QWZ13_01560 [Reinekea marina]|uniref:hypothetical protein n=1 Tax=Reinekea marina TaxID=1310421 RepID=UPI0025B46AC1|nr:hypothetical protein [Reinekea marina]MDN3647591.1 hypothetical protein [Reinekea marina]